jgi:hypothetical protein
MNDLKQFEKKDKTNTSIIKGCQKVYEEAPATDHLLRAEILELTEQSKRELAKTHAEYEIFKKYKTRTAISK